MTKKRCVIDNSQGAIVGYLRKSDVKFPAKSTVEERRKIVEDLKRFRTSELIQDAANAGVGPITEWYCDMDISGTGKYLDKRTDFLRMTQRAKEGKIRVVVTRDLSRANRSLVNNEIWIEELKRCNVQLIAEDLPQTGSESVNKLSRRNLGAFYEFMAERTGELIRSHHFTEVSEGRWVGRTIDMWGLRYNPETKGYDYDPFTADRAIFVYETFNTCLGVAGATAREMNRLYQENAPRATLSPRGSEWATDMVLDFVRLSVYRRKAYYTLWADIGGRRERESSISVDMPHLIPEVIPPDIVAETDRFLEERAPWREELQQRQKAGRLEHTYTGLLKCGDCGANMVTLKNPDGRGGKGEIRWVSWLCQNAAMGECVHPRKISTQQYRLDALIKRAILLAFDLSKEEQQAKKRPARSRVARGTENMDRQLAEIDRRIAAAEQMYEGGSIGYTWEKLQSRLGQLTEERNRLLALKTVDEPEKISTATLTPKQWREMRERIDLIWDSDEICFDKSKSAYLRTLGLRADVVVSVRAPKRRRAGNERQYPGPVTVRVHVEALGRTDERAIEISETEEEFKAYAHWRASFGNMGGRPRKKPVGISDG
ncbi:MAG TPA: recombinase family protein [Bryobacteraceae bacterium]|nr:recombinase family protein [Bryobacteraceae bacterium]